MYRFIIATCLAALLLGASACPEPPEEEPPERGEGVASIGPDGGVVALPGGTSLTIAAGLLDGDVDFTITEVDPVDIPHLDAGFVLIGPSFRLTPEGGSFASTVSLSVPAVDLPEGTEPGDVVLVQSSPGIADGGFEEGESRTSTTVLGHPLKAADGATDDSVLFDIRSIGDTTFQAIVYDPALTPEEGERGARDHIGPSGSNLDQLCSAAMAFAGVAPPADIDAKVETINAMGLSAIVGYTLRVGRVPSEVDYLASLNAFHARVCLAAYESLAFLQALGFYWIPPDPVQITFEYSDGSPGSCNGNLAVATGKGVVVYFNTKCLVDYQGFNPSSSSRAGWNEVVSGRPLSEQVDFLEATIAHELFHYVEDWADGDLADGFGIEDTDRSFTEGGADMIGDLVYDQAYGFAMTPLELWNGDFWAVKYHTHAFWRWLDWTQEQNSLIGNGSLARVLGKVRARYDALGSVAQLFSDEKITWADIDQTIGEMFPSRVSYDHDRALADFAANYLFLHDFERGDTPGCAVPGSCPDPPTSDAFLDARGFLSDEVTAGELWGPWRFSGVGGGTVTHDPLIDEHTTNNPAMFITPASRANLPEALTFPIPQHGARVIRIQLPDPATDPNTTDYPIRLTMWASEITDSSDRRSHVAFRLFDKPPVGSSPAPPRAIGLAAVHELKTTPGQETAVLIGGAVANTDELFLIATNYGDDDVAAHVTIEEAWLVGHTLAGFGGSIGSFDPVSGLTVASCDSGFGGPDLSDPVLGDTYRTDVQRIYTPVDGWAVAYPYNRQIRLYSRVNCDHYATIEFPASGPGPVAMDLDADGSSLVVGLQDPGDPCSPGGISVVDLDLLSDPTASGIVASVATPVGVGDIKIGIGFVGGVPTAFATQPGETSACFSSFIRAADLDNLVALGVGADPLVALEDIPIGGKYVHLPARLSTTAARDWLAWTTGEEFGRLVLMRVWDRTYWVIDPVDPVNDPFDTPTDVEVAEHPSTGDIMLFFTTYWQSATWVDPFAVCNDTPLGCGGYNLVRFSPISGGHELLSRRVLPYLGPNRIALNPTLTRAFVTYSNRSDVTILDLGSGGFEEFSVLGSSVMEILPTEIVLPRYGL
jgi:hypothetical protein